MAGGGGAWKVAYADFVTAMMAFFLVMWITAQSQKVKEAVAHHFSDPFGLQDKNSKSGGLDTAGPPMQFNENQRFSVKPKLLVDQDDIRHQLGTMIFFKNNSAKMDEQAKAAIEALVPNLTSQFNAVEIVAYADRQATSSGGDGPWVLVQQRCLAVKEFLIDWGVPPHKIRLVQRVADEDTAENGELKPPTQTQPNRLEIRVSRPEMEK
jgi:chemotaxis protein MotB